MTNRKIDKVSRRKGRISWLLTSAIALPVVVLVMGLSAATANALLDEGPSTGTGPAAANVVPPMELPPVVALGGSPTATTGAPTATDLPPTDVPPTETPVPGARIFTGDFVVTDEDCGGGTFSLTLTPDGTGIVLLSVVGFNVGGNPNDNETAFEPPLPIAGDGTFSSSGPLAPPLDAILSTLVGTFNFGVDPATVSGTLTIALVADPSNVLCEATFSGEELPAGAEPPTPAATSAPSLPATGSGAGGDSTGVLWAVVVGIVGIVALGAAGAASLRRRRA